ncbi:DUF58 domain-containing protein [Thermofilum pendens]|uniref:DUF58 domain-containing protein n=1 Tax=Thermofilum pendens (strain DSM 2475 / Hrk 5) TaxID=368408 RepID=A1S113_THEPD|nr:DUF58 domain-containing protein [Thermofilum pendens]ABL79143.1 hypothetical protein Tpen_1748 [Thermofilum pendens Hrk 5]
MDDHCRAARSALRIAERDVANYATGTSPVSSMGLGLEYVDFREYQPFDDARHIDWRATARSPGPDGGYRPIVKVYRAERKTRVALAVDLSASMLYQSKPKTLVYALAVIAAVADTLEDTFTLVLSTGRGFEVYGKVKPRDLPHIIASRICASTAPGKATLGEIAARLLALPRAPVLLVTDYAHSLEDFERSSKTLAASRGAAYLLVYDWWEVHPPPDALATLVDPETGSRVHGRLREVYAGIARHVALARSRLTSGGSAFMDTCWQKAREDRARLSLLYLKARSLKPPR